MRYPISSIKLTLRVTLEGASAMNYNQVSPEVNVMLRVSCGPSMTDFGLAKKYLLHGTLPSLPDLDIALSLLVLLFPLPISRFFAGLPCTS